jgi:hypothetical protein
MKGNILKKTGDDTKARKISRKGLCTQCEFITFAAQN